MCLHEWTAFAHRKVNSPHLLNHSFHFPLLAEHHVVQVFDPLTEIHSFRLQLFGSKQKAVKPTNKSITLLKIAFHRYVQPGQVVLGSRNLTGVKKKKKDCSTLDWLIDLQILILQMLQHYLWLHVSENVKMSDSSLQQHLKHESYFFTLDKKYDKTVSTQGAFCICSADSEQIQLYDNLVNY